MRLLWEHGHAIAPRFKYVRYLDIKGDVELYDLPNDPHEAHNLAGSRPDIAKSMDALPQARLQVDQMSVEGHGERH